MSAKFEMSPIERVPIDLLEACDTRPIDLLDACGTRQIDETQLDKSPMEKLLMDLVDVCNCRRSGRFKRCMSINSSGNSSSGCMGILPSNAVCGGVADCVSPPYSELLMTLHTFSSALSQLSLHSDVRGRLVKDELKSAME
eukprot:CAMPEP_0194301856 /NCGR_PEP_ID=MMETSP0169-20130528/62018_1 /TAXON_ID=218684 /ORGANISM="Corethron pennatum, Strain L29A3" /LENGTH=140 /DNA_ID=CAMNT_0039052131 /DNA_START=442 /DNA_END=864 /DNA_ORIENTATION=-